MCEGALLRESSWERENGWERLGGSRLKRGGGNWERKSRWEREPFKTGRGQLGKKEPLGEGAVKRQIGGGAVGEGERFDGLFPLTSSFKFHFHPLSKVPLYECRGQHIEGLVTVL